VAQAFLPVLVSARRSSSNQFTTACGGFNAAMPQASRSKRR